MVESLNYFLSMYAPLIHDPIWQSFVIILMYCMLPFLLYFLFRNRVKFLTLKFVMLVFFIFPVLAMIIFGLWRIV